MVSKLQICWEGPRYRKISHWGSGFFRLEWECGDEMVKRRRRLGTEGISVFTRDLGTLLDSQDWLLSGLRSILPNGRGMVKEYNVLVFVEVDSLDVLCATIGACLSCLLLSSSLFLFSFRPPSLYFFLQRMYGSFLKRSTSRLPCIVFVSSSISLSLSFLLSLFLLLIFSILLCGKGYYHKLADSVFKSWYRKSREWLLLSGQHLNT